MKYVVSLVIFIMASFSFAHSPLTSMVPQDGSSLIKAPSQLELVFKSPAKLIKVKMIRLSGNSNISVFESLFADYEGDEITLDGDFLMKVTEEHIIGLPPLKNGPYIVIWRALGVDGHVIKGNFSFKVISG